MTQSLSPSQGWAVLHLFCRARAGADGQAIAAAVKGAEGDGHQVVPFSVLGHKADFGFLALGPDLWRLRSLQTDLQGAGVEVVWSYVSLTEVSEYAKGLPEEMLEARLHPRLPPAGMTAFCFYPMSKRRAPAPGENWYLLPYEDRETHMRGHGKSGRNFRGRVLQLITGSTGIDDHEWGVTLFAVHPDDLKDVVYTLRFDEASARYAEFGPFVAGMVASVEQVMASVGVA